ncbi:ATP-binding protein [Arcobacter sp. YIC-80]|uniref:sensor histidine kinase n=1 Tax=Arcobacter sp. YIC-80 TaxID=3376683 RepID=UPI00384BD056
MVEINKLSKQNRNFGVKLFLSYIVFTVLLIISITIIHIYFSQDLVANKFLREVKLQSSEKKDTFDKYFQTKKDALQAISKNEYFIKYVENGSYKYYIDLLLLTVMEANKDYMQIRYINELGREVLRFDREKHSHEPYKSQSLQNKANRYYFKNVSKMKKNDVWFSNIDLNIEHGHLEIPYKPVVRVATPLIIQGNFKGILIINIFMEELLKNITNSSLYDIYLTDDNGYYLKHKNKEFDWSYYNSKKTLKDDFDIRFIYKIKENKDSSFVYNKNIFVQTLNLDNQKLNLIMLEKEESIEEVENNNNTMIVAILIFATIMSLLFTFIFTRKLEGLFKLVVSQADKLHDLATNLDNKVVLKTFEIAKKDRLLQNQSKLAELGDMIGNIAHQWRHPLTRLSLTLQNLRAYKKKNRMSDEMFDEAMSNSLYQIEFMSNTIDNFKNFYKKDEKKSDFIVREAVENVLNIIGAVLEHSNIKLNINCQEKVTLHGNKNEFSQVLMNLIINAKDAIDENKIENGKIDINISKTKEYKKIEVSDNAGGVPSCLIEEIFNPYFTTKEEKGTGIGLYLSKAIIEDKMNGKLLVVNKEQGAVFTILL